MMGRGSAREVRSVYVHVQPSHKENLMGVDRFTAGKIKGGNENTDSE